MMPPSRFFALEMDMERLQYVGDLERTQTRGVCDSAFVGFAACGYHHNRFIFLARRSNA
jgi:hypothetical protein